jgi:hypothetical protein
VQRIFLVATVVGVMAAILAASASASAAVRHGVTAHTASASQGISWGPCSEADLQQAGAQCGYLSVPLDYANRSGPQIQLAVSRIEHTSSD